MTTQSLLEGGFVFHDLRHTVKTWMLRAGVSRTYRDLLLGHSMLGMDSYYLNPGIEDLREAMNIYTDWLVKILDKPLDEQGQDGQGEKTG